MYDTKKELQRDAEILEGNIKLFEKRIPEWQGMTQDMIDKLPGMKKELEELKIKIAKFPD